MTTTPPIVWLQRCTDDEQHDNDSLNVSCGHWDPFDMDCIGNCDENGHIVYTHLYTNAQYHYQFIHTTSQHVVHQSIVDSGLYRFMFQSNLQQHLLLLPFECEYLYRTNMLNGDQRVECQCIARHSTTITCFDVDYYGQFVVTGDMNGTVCVWLLPDVDDDVQLSTPIHEIHHAHKRQITQIRTLVQAFVSGGVDHFVRLWNVPDGACLKEFSIETMSVSSLLSWRCDVSNHELLACGTIEGTMYVWSLNTMELMDIVYDSDSEVMTMSANDDGSVVCSGHLNGDIRWYRVDVDGQPLHLLSVRAMTGPVVSVEFATSAERSGQMMAWMCNSRFLFDDVPTRVDRVEAAAVPPQTPPVNVVGVDPHDDESNSVEDCEARPQAPPIPVPHPVASSNDDGNTVTREPTNDFDAIVDEEAVPRSAPPKRRSTKPTRPGPLVVHHSDTTRQDVIIAEKSSPMDMNSLDANAMVYAAPQQFSSHWLEGHLRAINQEEFTVDEKEVRARIEKALKVETTQERASGALNRSKRRNFSSLPKVQPSPEQVKRLTHPKVEKQVDTLWLKSVEAVPQVTSLLEQERSKLEVQVHDNSGEWRQALNTLKRRQRRKKHSRGSSSDFESARTIPTSSASEWPTDSSYGFTELANQGGNQSWHHQAYLADLDNVFMA